MWLAQWIIASVVVAGLIVVAIERKAWTFLRATSSDKHEETASTSLRKTTAETLLAESPKLAAFETPEFLLKIALDLYERKHAAMRALDDKAQKLVALIGGGATLFALLGGLTGGIHTTLTPLLALSALCFLGSLAFALIALLPRDTDIPTVSAYNSPKVLQGPEYRAKIARELIETWEAIALEIRPILKRKGLAVYLSMVLIAVGAFVLITNFSFLQGNTKEPQTQRLRCSTSIARRPSRLTLTCEGPTT